MCKITLADFSHKNQLAELWAEAFGDDENFIASFLDAYMIPEYNVPVVLDKNRNNGKIASALYLIDFDLYSDTKVLGQCAYLFAAATKKEYRNKGYMSKLIEYSSELCKSRGHKAIFLFPQDKNQKLFDFYSKFGFKDIYAAKKITFGLGGKKTKRDLTGFKLENQDITDAGIFDGLYNSYAEFAIKQELAPIKDRFFYFKCASSYLDVSENPDIKAYFAIFQHNFEQYVEKLCYVFYKKYKNNYYIDDIIIPEYNNIHNVTSKKPAEIAELLSDYLLNSSDNINNNINEINIEINVPPESFSDSKNIPLAMILPLSDDINNIISNLKKPVYINMFMNI